MWQWMKFVGIWKKKPVFEEEVNDLKMKAVEAINGNQFQQLQGACWTRVTLKETKERHVWAVRRVRAPETEESHGFAVVYVDDMLLLGETEQVKAVADAVKSLWECSPLELRNEKKELRFCGMELRRYKKGVFLSQTGYLVEMLKRYEVQGVEAYPLPKVEDREDEEPDLKALRRAQTLVGELLWTSKNKTRCGVCHRATWSSCPHATQLCEHFGEAPAQIPARHN